MVIALLRKSSLNQMSCVKALAKSLLSELVRLFTSDPLERPKEDDFCLELVGLDGKKIKPGITSGIIAELSDCNVSLSQQRKKRTIPSTLGPLDDVERYTQLSSHPLHKTSKPGILSLDIHHAKARPLLGHAVDTDQVDGLVDPMLEKNYVETELLLMIKAAAACVRHSASKRPQMGQVLRAFNGLSPDDLSNEMRVGESELYDPAQQSAQIRWLRGIAFGNEDFSAGFFSEASESQHTQNPTFLGPSLTPDSSGPSGIRVVD